MKTKNAASSAPLSSVGQPIFSAAYWRDALAQLKDLRMLVIAAMLIALRVALKSLGIPVFTNDLYIYFGYLANALGGMIYGPVVALAAAAVSDTLGALIAQSSSGPYFLPFILVEMLGSFLYAIVLWRRSVTVTRIFVSKFLVTFLANIVLNPIIMIWYYAWLNNGKSYALVTVPRLLKNTAMLPVEALLLALFLSAITPALASLHLIDKEQTKPVFKPRHYVLLGALLLIAAAAVVFMIFVYPSIKK